MASSEDAQYRHWFGGGPRPGSDPPYLEPSTSRGRCVRWSFRCSAWRKGRRLNFPAPSARTKSARPPAPSTTSKSCSPRKPRREAEAKIEQDKRAEAERQAAMQKMADEFEAAVGGIVRAAVAGDFSQRVDVHGKTGLVLNVGTAINSMCDNIGKALTISSRCLTRWPTAI